jgi:tetratricopeptide (TPR) repeat protein
MRYFLSIVFAVIIFSQCKNFTKKNTYANLPADSAQYMMLCDALKEDSNRADLLYKRAIYLFKKQLFLPALADANRASILDTTKSEYFLLLGNICFAVNKTKIAALSYERSIMLDKENYAAYLKLGELYYLVKEHPNSLQNYDEALRIQPACEQCYFYKGLNYREMVQLQHHDELAEQMFQKAIAINPNYFDAYIQLGEMNDKLKPEIALAYFNAAVKIQPRSVEALYHRAYHYQMQHNYDSAGADYKRIVEINQNFINAYFNVAFMNMEQHKWKEAIEGFKLVTKMDDSNVGAWYNLGLCYEQTKEKEKAKKAYNECLLIDKEYSNATERLQSLK